MARTNPIISQTGFLNLYYLFKIRFLTILFYTSQCYFTIKKLKGGERCFQDFNYILFQDSSICVSASILHTLFTYPFIYLSIYLYIAVYTSIYIDIYQYTEICMNRYCRCFVSDTSSCYHPHAVQFSPLYN